MPGHVGHCHHKGGPGMVAVGAAVAGLSNSGTHTLFQYNAYVMILNVIFAVV